MKRILIRTSAYNAEKTLSRAVDSILAQDFGDYMPAYILIDNGSSDGTGEIIDEYAEKYDWIVPIRHEVNLRGQFPATLPETLAAYPGDGYFFSLDADDAYNPDFLKKMLSFMEDHQLDIAACGNAFIDGGSGRVVGFRKVEHHLVMEKPEEYDALFGMYHQFMRTVWGKVYKLSVLRKCGFENAKQVSYGEDTACVMEAFRNARRIGIFAETLHQYYISPKSVSYLLDHKRIASDRILHEETCRFLASKCGAVSPQNERFLFLVYFNAIKDTLNVLLRTPMPPMEMIKSMWDIFTCDATRELFLGNSVAADALDIIRTPILKLILALDICRSAEGAKLAVDILTAMYGVQTRPDIVMELLKDNCGQPPKQ